MSLALGISFYFVPSSAQAQNTHNDIPTTADPSIQEIEAIDLLMGDLILEIDIPGGTAPPPGAAEIEIEISALSLEGVKAYSAEQLRSLYAEHLGQTRALATLYAIADAISAHYRADGFGLSYAFVPPQESDDGSFRLHVVEGYIDRIIVQDAPEHLKPALVRMLAPVLESRPTSLRLLERQLLLVNDLPGLSLASTLRPAREGQGAADLILVASFQPYAAGLSIDNRGSAYAGPWQATAWAEANSLARFGDQLSGSVTVASDPRELSSTSFGYHMPLFENRMRVGGSLTYATSEPGDEMRDLEVDSRTLAFDLGAELPLLVDRGQFLSLRGAFNYMDVDTDILGSRISEDRLRSVSVTASYAVSGLLGGASNASATLEQGLDAFGAHESPQEDTSRADAEAAFTRLSLRASHQQPLGYDLSAVLSAAGQYAFTPLLAAREFALGGADFGRGYDAGEEVGDHGVAASLELDYELDLGQSWIDRSQLYSFADYGHAWQKGNDGDSAALASAGAGARIHFVSGTDLSLEYAHPLTDSPSKTYGLGDGRLFLRVNQRF